MLNLLKRRSPHDKAKNEAANLTKIHYHLKNNTPSGQKIKAAFQLEPIFDETVACGGTRKKHYDLGIKWLMPNREKKVEYKGSEEHRPIDTTKPPWANAVQFYNGTGNTFTVGRLYAQQFYNTMLDDIIAHLDIKTPKPSYEAWAKDAFKQAKPKTPFVCELREKGYKSQYLSDMRVKFNKTFVLPAEQLAVLKAEVLKKANEVLREKEYWLQINGNIDEPTQFDIHWSGKVEINDIVEVKQHGNSGCDINFEFICDDGHSFFGKLRWGYGQCITNIRLDLK